MSIDSAKTRAHQRISLLGSVLAMAVLSAVQLGFYLNGYDFTADLYLPGSLPTLTAILWILAAAVAFLLAFRLPGKAVCTELKVRPTPFTDFASLLSVAALAGALAFPLLWKNNGADPLGQLLASAAPTDSTARTMLLLSMAFAIPAALHFILQFAYHRSYPQSACAVLFWVGFSALRVYFDMRYLLMSPRRILHLVALVSVMLFLIAELRLARGIATHRFYAVTASIMLVIAGCDAVTNLILVVMGWVAMDSEFCTYCFLLAVSLYAAARLASLGKTDTPKPAAASAFPVGTDGKGIPAEASAEGIPPETAPIEDTDIAALPSENASESGEEQ